MVDVGAASKAAGVSVRTIYRWISEGWLHRDDGLISLDELDAVRATRRRAELVKRLNS